MDEPEVQPAAVDEPEEKLAAVYGPTDEAAAVEAAVGVGSLPMAAPAMTRRSSKWGWWQLLCWVGVRICGV